MSLYNMLFGMNAQLAEVASTILGFRVDERFPRFRDIFAKAEDAPFEADLYVYTRMGGGNRTCWENGEKGCGCSACASAALEHEPWIVGSYDDSFDCTYRTFGVRLTPEQKAEFEAVVTKGMDDAFKARVLVLFPGLADKLGKAEASL